MTATTIVLSVLLALTIASNADPKVIKKRDQFPSFTTPDFYSLFCKNNPFASQFAVCSTTVPATPSTSTTTMSTTTESSTTSDNFEHESSTSTPFELETTAAPDANSSSTVLERAHWCRFNNGSHISLGYTFMYSACAICQCTLSRAIRCTTLQCMPNFCIDDSTPTRRPGQCCSQCAYENGSSSCTYRGVTFPHGKRSLCFPSDCMWKTMFFFARDPRPTCEQRHAMLVSIGKHRMSPIGCFSLR